MSRKVSKLIVLPPADWVHPDDFRRLLELRDLRKAWASWLRTFEWHHYATLTFKRPVTCGAAAAFFRRWIRRLEQRAGRRVDWFAVVELSRAGDVHLHALVGRTGDVTPKKLGAAWSWGWTRIARYDPRRGATAYACKHLATPSGEYDVSARLVENPPTLSGVRSGRSERPPGGRQPPLQGAAIR